MNKRGEGRDKKKKKKERKKEPRIFTPSSVPSSTIPYCWPNNCLSGRPPLPSPSD